MPSKIEWTMETWNPTTGCDKVSAGCRGCYAEVMHRRLRAMGQAKYQHDFLGGAKEHPEDLRYPLSVKRPTTFFVDSMSDLFHDDISFDFIDNVFAVMDACPQHTFQILTKRAERAAGYFFENRGWRVGQLKHAYDSNDYNLSGWPLKNVWMGVSVEDDRVTNRMVYLRQMVAKVKFLSIEPLIGPLPNLNLEGIDWVIVGGESGPTARPMHPDWVRSIRDQCEVAGVPFFFKQWGAYGTRFKRMTDNVPVFKMWKDYHHFAYKDWAGAGDVCIDLDGKICRIGKDFQSAKYPVAIMHRMSKKESGNYLDGVQHLEMPAL